MPQTGQIRPSDELKDELSCRCQNGNNSEQVSQADEVSNCDDISFGDRRRSSQEACENNYEDISGYDNASNSDSCADANKRETETFENASNREEDGIDEEEECEPAFLPPDVDPAMCYAGDYEIGFSVNFLECLMKPLPVFGLNPDSAAQCLLYNKVKCSPECHGAGCSKCQLNKIFQADAAYPEGHVQYTPHSEYLYCLQFPQQKPVALVSLTPKVDDIEFHERNLRAYWSTKWLQNEKLELDSPFTRPPREGRKLPESKQWFKLPFQEVPRTLTKEILPNIDLTYVAKQGKMTATLTRPAQLLKSLHLELQAFDRIRLENEDVHKPLPDPQVMRLNPGVSDGQSAFEVVEYVRYKLMIKDPDSGEALDLLEFINSHRVLRVQESKEAPKQMNFLMERLTDQRGTFVLHVTFDEQLTNPSDPPTGEFYVDVDIGKHTRRMRLGVPESGANVTYMIEKMAGGMDADPHMASLSEIFLGKVDPKTLMTRDYQLRRWAQYLISTFDPATNEKKSLAILAYENAAMYIKEVAFGPAKLHVTVQRQPTLIQTASNFNNEGPTEVEPVARVDTGSRPPFYCCPLEFGQRRFFIRRSENPIGLAKSPSLTSSMRSLIVAEANEKEFNLDVDLAKMRARILPPRGSQRSNLRYTIEENSSSDSRSRVMQCGQEEDFPLQRWCHYTVAVCDSSQKHQSLFSFDVTDAEVANIRACDPEVRLTRKYPNQFV